MTYFQQDLTRAAEPTFKEGGPNEEEKGNKLICLY